MGSGDFQLGIDHSHHPSFKKEITPIPEEAEPDQYPHDHQDPVFKREGRHTGPREPAPDTFEEQPAALPLGQVCQDNRFTLGTDQVSYSLPIVCGILGAIPTSLMVQPAYLSLYLGSQSPGTLALSATLPMLQR